MTEAEHTFHEHPHALPGNSGEVSLDDLMGETGTAAGRRAAGRGPLLRLDQLELRTRREAVFGPLDWHLDAGRLGVIAGQQGSGRTSLLLALGGRMRGVTGSLVVDDGHGTPFDGIENPRELMRRVAVASIGGMAELERLLTVAESVDERSVTEGLGRKDGRQRFHALKQTLGVDIDDETLVDELSAPMRALTTALLACLRPADLVLYDDLDASLTPQQLTWMGRQLQLLGRLGHTFVVTVLNTAAMPQGSVILDLDTLSSNEEPDLPPVRDDVDPTQPTTPHDRATPNDHTAPHETASDPTPVEPRPDAPHRPAHALLDDDLQ